MTERAIKPAELATLKRPAPPVPPALKRETASLARPETREGK